MKCLCFRSGRPPCKRRWSSYPPVSGFCFTENTTQSTAQIALELGLTERAVEGRLYRLKRQLRKLPEGDEGA